MAVWEGDRFRTVVPADSAAFHGISGVQEDSEGDLFLSEQRGVLFIARTEVSKILKEPSARVQYQVFDVHDGLPGAVQQTNPYPTAVQGTDGRIWFSTSTGVAWIDPAHIPKNPLPPPIVIRSITSNGARYASPDGLRLPTRDLTIDYTALSLAVPERVHFRYKLEGSDTQWQEAGTRRQAFYTNLSPGKYRFRVIASNNDGVWNQTGASWAFSIAPTFYETLWFNALIALAGIGLIWLLCRLRVRHITARADLRYAERLEERTRIARELHDTLLQSFQGVLMRVQAGYNLVATRPEEAKKTFQIALDQGSDAMAEARATVQQLRDTPVITDNLAREIGSFYQHLQTSGANGTSASVTVEVQEAARELHPMLRDEVFRIASEALRNAFNHAEARRISVTITYGEREFQLHVRDDGQGIDPEILDRGAREGHWGLSGMRERAESLGGRLEVWSAPGAGTQIELGIPAARAYAKSPERRWRLFGKSRA